ncbi:MAG: thioredoxin family protein [Candidatus Wallbacteria bacterium]|nr:thioredoxin family protein [Candidatus Wallbacteria bacterium]
MKKIIFYVLITALSFSCFAETGINWLTNYEQALTQSAEQNLPVFINFSGSDWCSWCIKLDKEVLSQEEFADWGVQHFIFMSVDFPKNTTQSPEIKEQNKKLKTQYSVNGLPTVKIIDSTEKVLLSTGYMNNHTPAMYIDHLSYHLGWTKGTVRNDWITDFEQAKKQSAEKNLPILADFSGSDWCSWCKKLDKEVFSQQVFLDWAKDHVVLLMVDFPEYTQLPAAQQAANDALAKQFDIKGFPTVILIDETGKEKARTGYKAGGPQNYISHIESLIGQ